MRGKDAPTVITCLVWLELDTPTPASWHALAVVVLGCPLEPHRRWSPGSAVLRTVESQPGVRHAEVSRLCQKQDASRGLGGRKTRRRICGVPAAAKIGMARGHRRGPLMGKHGHLPQPGGLQQDATVGNLGRRLLASGRLLRPTESRPGHQQEMNGHPPPSSRRALGNWWRTRGRTTHTPTDVCEWSRRSPWYNTTLPK